MATRKKTQRQSGLAAADWDCLLRKIPGYDPFRDAGDCRFDAVRAKRALDFFPACLKHTKGERAGQPFALEPWQQAIIANLFGWIKPNGCRRYRELNLWVPRKNGKSTLAAGIALLLLFGDREPGAEIYSAANDRPQAALVFDQARQMRDACPALVGMSKVRESYKSITGPLLSVYRAISAETKTKDGFNAHGVIYDEIHASVSRKLYDVLATAMGSRSQPLLLVITTADFDRESIGNEKYDYAAKVRDGILCDPQLLPVLYEADRKDDWSSPEIWAKANPNLGVSVSLEYLQRECRRAEAVAAYENTFKRLHLNIRTEQDDRWLQMTAWDMGAGELPELRGRRGVCAFDVASTKDLAAVALVFELGDGAIAVLPHFFIPEEGAAERERRDRVPYLAWSKQGLVTLTQGNRIDQAYIRKHIRERCHDYGISQIGYDPWNANKLALELQDEDGFELVQIRQGTATMNEPAKQLERLLPAGKVLHGGNPMLRWQAANVAVKTDSKGNICPQKPSKNSPNKVDGIICLVMGIAMLMQPGRRSAYTEDRGLLVV